MYLQIRTNLKQAQNRRKKMNKFTSGCASIVTSRHSGRHSQIHIDWPHNPRIELKHPIFLVLCWYLSWSAHNNLGGSYQLELGVSPWLSLTHTLGATQWSELTVVYCAELSRHISKSVIFQLPDPGNDKIPMGLLNLHYSLQHPLL